MKDNIIFHNKFFSIVVNCFQKLLSSWWRTTWCWYYFLFQLLWIAFKNYYLRDEGQLAQAIIAEVVSCELLSKIIIFVMKDNDYNCSWIHLLVVNCFQKLLSSWWRTTVFPSGRKPSELWIAFKNYYLRDEGQQKSGFSRCKSGCELLSKIIIFVMKDNPEVTWYRSTFVVNCFQKLLSSWWRTTNLYDYILDDPLWIAFKNYYLRDEGQQGFLRVFIINSCELLSKIIIFVMKDNDVIPLLSSFKVVNCFQKLLSSWWRTTWKKEFLNCCSLWIAFKNYYLRDEGQPSLSPLLHKTCCELLSKIIIFVMKDNYSC